MATSLYYNPFIPAYSGLGLPIGGAKTYFYLTGTSTLAPIYADVAQTTPLLNPVSANLAGKYPPIYLDKSVIYRITQTDSTGAPIGDAVDPYIPGITAKGDPGGNVMSIGLFTGASALTIPTGTSTVRTSGYAAHGKGIADYVESDQGSSSANIAYQAANPRSSFISANSRLFTLVTTGAVNPLMFGAIGNGSTDDTAALQAMLVSSSRVFDFLDSTKEYLITGTLIPPSNSFLTGSYARIKQGSVRTVIFDISNINNITISFLHFVGYNNDFIQSSSSLARGINAYNCVNVTIQHCRFDKFTQTAAWFNNVSNLRFNFNTITGPVGVLNPTGVPSVTTTNYGFVLENDTRDFVVMGNTVSGTSEGLSTQACYDGKIIGNTITDTAVEHGMYFGNGSHDLVIANNNIHNTYLLGLKVQQQTGSPVAIKNIIITGNSIRNTGDQGILLSNGSTSTAAPQPDRLDNVVVSNNTIESVAASGINVQNVTHGIISNNTIRNTGQHGINYGGCDDLLITGNNTYDTGLNGISDQNTSNRVTIKSNVIRDAARTGISGSQNGMYFEFTTDLTIEGNDIQDSRSKVQFSIYVVGPSLGTVVLSGNLCKGSVQADLRFGSTTTPLRYLGDNLLLSTIRSLSSVPVPSIASAATITLPSRGSLFRITGTTNITNIVRNGQDGRVVTLLFDGALTVTRGGSLLVATSFVTTSDDTLTLVCDGATDRWVELSRSVN